MLLGQRSSGIIEVFVIEVQDVVQHVSAFCGGRMYVEVFRLLEETDGFAPSALLHGDATFPKENFTGLSEGLFKLFADRLSLFEFPFFQGFLNASSQFVVVGGVEIHR